MQDSLHLYELCFFGIFVILISIMAIPKISSALSEHDSSQRKERNKLQGNRAILLDEYKKEEVNAKASEQRWRKFTTHESKAFKLKTEKDEQELNRLKLEEVFKHEEKALKDMIMVKKDEILKRMLDQIKGKFIAINEQTVISFEDQLSKMNDFLKKST